MILYIASLGSDITKTVADVSHALFYPVLILAMVAALADVYEFGRLTVEVAMRRQKETDKFVAVAQQAQATARAGDAGGAQALLKSQAYGEHLENAYIRTLLSPTPLDAERAAVEYDIYVSKRLDRVRLLTRAGPALGLMGTLIPLAPALAALGRGDAKVLTDELQTAFAITVVGVGVGLVAFAIAVVHERLYSRDLANIDYLRQLRGDVVAVAQATMPGLATTAVQAPATTARPVAAPVAPASPAPASPAPAPAAPATAPTAATPAAPTPAPTPAPGVPATGAGFPQQQPATAGKKKKFGLKKKGAPAPAAQPLPGAYPPAVPPAPVDKSPSIPVTPPPGITPGNPPRPPV